MRLYYEDAMETEFPWMRWEFRQTPTSEWSPLSKSPRWDSHCEYRRRPGKVIKIGQHSIPEPVRQELEIGQAYYIPSIVSHDFVFRSQWNGNKYDKSRLLAGIIHLTEEAAALHAKALIQFTQK